MSTRPSNAPHAGGASYGADNQLAPLWHDELAQVYTATAYQLTPPKLNRGNAMTTISAQYAMRNIVLRNKKAQENWVK